MFLYSIKARYFLYKIAQYFIIYVTAHQGSEPNICDATLCIDEGDQDREKKRKKG